MINISQKTIALLFSLCSLDRVVQGMKWTRGLTSEPIFCRKALDCDQCASWGCSWASGQCLDSCLEVADVACFDGEGMCAKAHNHDEDYAICGAQKGCSLCTSTSLSRGDGHCSWHPQWQSCKPLLCDAWSCGTETCMSPEEERCFIAGSSGSCIGCLENGCEWTNGSCVSSCDNIADAACYSQQSVRGHTINEICLVANTVEMDTLLCSVPDICGLCLSTTKSDGVSTCRWYTNENGDGWCGIGACDMFGNCGSDFCPFEEIEIPVPLPEAASGPQTEEIPVPLPEEVPVLFPADGLSKPCSSKTTCSSCLSGEDNCAWVAGSCQKSCDVIADAACYTLSSAPDKSGQEICALVAEEHADEKLCSADTCQDCTSISKSDGKQKCSWYTDGTSGWCGVGGCDMKGICGSADPDACPVLSVHGNMRGPSKKRSSFLNALLP